MITTIDYNKLKLIARGAGSYLLWEGINRFEVYYINQGPVVFRAIIKKNDGALAFVSGLKDVVVIKDRLVDSGVEVAKLLKMLNMKK